MDPAGATAAGLHAAVWLAPLVAVVVGVVIVAIRISGVDTRPAPDAAPGGRRDERANPAELERET